MGAKIYFLDAWVSWSLFFMFILSVGLMLCGKTAESKDKVKQRAPEQRTQGRVLGVWILHPTPQMWPPVQRMTGRLASSHSFRDITIWQLSSVSPGGNRAMFRSFSLNWLWTSPWQQYTTAGRGSSGKFWGYTWKVAHLWRTSFHQPKVETSCVSAV